MYTAIPDHEVITVNRYEEQIEYTRKVGVG